MTTVAPFFVSPAYAAIPQAINYQSRLLDSAGTAVASATAIQFSLYNHPTNGAYSDAPSAAGSLVWKESYDQPAGACASITPDSKGYFYLRLGSCSAFPSYLTFSEPLYLGVKIGSDPEATPRVPFSAHPYALNSERLNNLQATTTAQANKLLALDNNQNFNIATGTFMGAGLSVTGSSTLQSLTFTMATGSFLNLTSALAIGGIQLDSIGSDNITSGASLVGVFDEFDNSNATTVQAALRDFDVAITAVSSSVYAMTLQKVTDNGNTTTNAIVFAGGTSTAALHLAGRDTVGMNDARATELLNILGGATASAILKLDADDGAGAGNRAGIYINSDYAGGGDGVIQFSNNGTPDAYISSDPSTLNIVAQNAGDGVTITTSNAHQFRFEGSGNFGIGSVTADLFKLQVSGHAGPSAHNAYDLGSATTSWRNIWSAGFVSTTALYINGQFVNVNSSTNIYTSDGSIPVTRNVTITDGNELRFLDQSNPANYLYLQTDYNSNGNLKIGGVNNDEGGTNSYVEFKDNFNLFAANGMELNASTNQIDLYGSNAVFTIGGGNQFNDLGAVGSRYGLRYADDYSSDFVDRSLVDKAYVDNAIVNSTTTLNAAYNGGGAALGRQIFTTNGANPVEILNPGTDQWETSLALTNAGNGGGIAFQTMQSFGDYGGRLYFTDNTSDPENGTGGYMYMDNQSSAYEFGYQTAGVRNTSFYIDYSQMALNVPGSPSNGALRVGASNYNVPVLTLAAPGASNYMQISVGTSTPEGRVMANSGSVYHRTDGVGGDRQLYVKTTDGVNTGWVPLSSAGSMSDADNDTKIQVEETTDEDYIRFDTAGVERMYIANDGKIGVGTTAPLVSLFTVGPNTHEASSFSVSGIGGMTNIANFRDKNGENVFRAAGSVADGDLIVGFGDMDYGGNGTSLQVDYANDAVIMSNSEFRFMEAASAGNYVGFIAPSALSANTIWTLPSQDGTTGQVLTTDGSGTLSWGSAAATGDFWSLNGNMANATSGSVLAVGPGKQISIGRYNDYDSWVTLWSGHGAPGSDNPGGEVSLNAGYGDGSGNGGSFYITAGEGGGTTGSGGSMQLSAGSASNDGNGGAFYINGGGGSLSGAGGEVSLVAGMAGSIGPTGGLVRIKGGDADNGVGGNVNIVGGYNAAGNDGRVILGYDADNGRRVGQTYVGTSTFGGFSGALVVDSNTGSAIDLITSDDPNGMTLGSDRWGGEFGWTYNRSNKILVATRIGGGSNYDYVDLADRAVTINGVGSGGANPGYFGINNTDPQYALDVNSAYSWNPIASFNNINTGFHLFSTTGTPEGAVYGNMGDIAVDAERGMAYIKQSGNNTRTGWVGFATSTASGAALTLQQVTDNGNTTTNKIQFAGGTSTDDFTIRRPANDARLSVESGNSDAYFTLQGNGGASTLRMSSNNGGNWATIETASNGSFNLVADGRGTIWSDGPTGNVGIGGTIIPTELLQVHSDTRASVVKVSSDGGQNAHVIVDFDRAGGGEGSLSFRENGTQKGVINSGNSGYDFFGIAADNGAALDLFTSGQVRMHVATSGNIGIGTVAPTHKLTVDGGAVAADDLFKVSAGANVGYFSVYMDPSDDRNSIVKVMRDLSFVSEGWGETMMHLTGSGMGVGTTNPVYGIDLVGDIRISGETMLGMYAALPVTGHQPGSMAYNTTTRAAYLWNGLSWVAFATGTTPTQHWQKNANVLSPTDANAYQIAVSNNSASTLTGFKAVNTNDVSNYAGAVMELKGSGADFTNNVYFGKYGSGFWIPTWAGNGVLATDKSLVLGAVGTGSIVRFQVGGGYSSPATVATMDSDSMDFQSGVGVNVASNVVVQGQTSSTRGLFVNATGTNLYVKNQFMLGRYAVNPTSGIRSGAMVYNTASSTPFFWNGTRWIPFATGTNQTVTLDRAYDGGGSGAGRTITADAGAVYITGTTVGNALQVDMSSAGNAVSIANSGAGQGVSISQSGSGIGMYVRQNNGEGIVLDNNTGNDGIIVNNSAAGNGLNVNNDGTSGNGMYINNGTDGSGIYIYDTLGKAGINIQKPSGSGNLINMSNAGTGRGISLGSSSSGEAVRITNTGTGDSLYILDAGSDLTPFVLDASGNLGIGSATPQAKLQISDDNSASNVPLIQFQASNNSDIQSQIYFTAGGNATYWNVNSSGAGGAFILMDESAEVARFHGNAITFNEGGSAGTDFRVESDTQTHALFVDATNGYVGLDQSVPLAKLHVGNTTAGSLADYDYMRFMGSGDVDHRVYLPSGSNLMVWDFNVTGNGGAIEFQNYGTRVGMFTNSGLVVNEGGVIGVGLRVEGDTNANLLYTDAANDRVGIGTNAPAVRFQVTQSGNVVAAFDRTTNDGTIISIRQDGIEEGTISVAGNTVSYNAFTGSHYAWTDEAIEQGMLVRMNDQNRRLHGRQDSEILYGVAAATSANDPRILGAYLALQEPTKVADNDNPHLIAAVGNGDVWVVDQGQNVASGDYLISSDVKGHAMKDTGAYPVSYVFARAAEPIDWSQVTSTVDGIKHAKISVLFESFARNNSIAAIQPAAMGNVLAGTEYGPTSTELAVVNTAFPGSVTVLDHVELSKDSVGQAVILVGATRVHVSFERAYDTLPIVTVTPHGARRMDYGVENVSLTGFDVVLDPIQYKDVLFDWHAFGEREAKVFVSNGTTADIELTDMGTSKLETQINATAQPEPTPVTEEPTQDQSEPAPVVIDSGAQVTSTEPVVVEDPAQEIGSQPELPVETATSTGE